MPGVEILHANEGLAVGNLNGIYINVVRKPSNLADLSHIRRTLEGHFKRYQKIGSIAVIEPHAAQSPEKEVREATSALTRDFQSLAAAIVIEGDGFRAAASRTLIATIYLVARPAYPHKICATVDDGANWLLGLIKPNPFGVSPAEVSRSVEQVRAAIRSAPPA
jgi:hypothetical protein